MSLSKSSKISQQNITAPNSKNSSTYEFEDFRLDAAHLMLYKNGKTISLKPKVVETLVALVERRGEVVGKNELMNRLWADSFVEESNLTQNIYLLRKTLGNCADGQPFIETFSRRGYRLNGEIKTQNNSAELLVATHTKTQTVIEETIENKPRRNLLLVGGAIITGGLLILSGILLTNYRNKQSAAAAPPQEVLIKRLTPDGRIIYTSTRSGNADLWLMNHDGSNQKQLTSNAGSWNGRPQVTPDGRYIVFASSRTNSNQIWRMEIDGGNQIQLTDGGEFPSLTPDGQWIFYSLSADNTTAIWKVSLDGGEPQRVPTQKDVTGPSVSPDGKFIAYYHNEPDAVKPWQIGLIPIDGGEPLKTYDFPANRGLPRWTADSKSLITMTGGSSDLWEYPLDGGQPRQLTDYQVERNAYFAFSPDFKQIAFSRGNDFSETVLINLANRSQK